MSKCPKNSCKLRDPIQRSNTAQDLRDDDCQKYPVPSSQPFEMSYVPSPATPRRSRPMVRVGGRHRCDL